MTDDAIVDFCVQEDVPVDKEKDAEPKQRLHGELVVRNGRCTKDLFKRLVEASSMSLRTQSLRIAVFPLRFVEEENLRDFAQHLSYRHRGMPHEVRIYDFPGEQHGAVAAVHTQIVLHSDNILEMIRARRPNPVFDVSDE
ncbi:hypothetical protein AAVH_09487 [Aphelenchoides avenae]|nr:hypothetical protein AAVH_09487 [Aphelenchus avenae]